MINKNYADYRAKAVYNLSGKWHYGYKVGACGNMRHHLVVDGQIDDDGDETIRRIPYAIDTLCMNSHITDYHNNPIYERDVVCVRNEFGEQEGPVGIVRYGQYRDNDQPEDYNLGWWIDWQNEEVPGLWRVELLFWVKERSLHIIGNVIDDPDLPTSLSTPKQVTAAEAIKYLTEHAAMRPMAEKPYYRAAVDALRMLAERD